MKSRLTNVPSVILNKAALWRAVITGMTVAVAVIVVWQVIDQRAHEHAGLATEHAVRMTKLVILQDTNNRLAALDRLAQRWTASGGKPRAEWEADAVRYVTDMPGFESIQWIDGKMQARWAVPLASSDILSSRDVLDIEQVKRAFERVRHSGEVVVTDPFEVADNGIVIAVVLPVSRDQSFDGFIIGVLRVGPWLDAVVGKLQTADHQVRILLQGFDVYQYRAHGDTADDSRTQRSSFDAQGLNWTVFVTPTSGVLSAGHADTSRLVLIVGLLLSVLITVVVYLALAARDRSRQLSDVANRLATLFRNLPGMAYRRPNEPNGSMDFVSGGCRALSGYPGSEFTRGQREWVELVHPDDRDRVISETAQAIGDDEPFELEYRIVDRSGEERWVWERGRPIKSEVDGSGYIEGFISDVTDRKRAESALDEARAFSEAVVDAAENEARQHREHLAHADRLNMLGEMATGIAHEINQPLTAISLFVQAGSRLVATEKPDRLPEIFEKLSKHAHRASAVIERMQTMARRQEGTRESVSCGTLLDEVANLAEAEARIRDMTIEVNTAPSLPDVSVDAVQIQQVALNLLRNGMESMQSVGCHDGNVICLNTDLREDGSIGISVVDCGTGVSGEVAETLFAPFSTTKKSGMGMGLSISRAIVIAHGGRLDFFNNEQSGATFYFTLPQAD